MARPNRPKLSVLRSAPMGAARYNVLTAKVEYAKELRGKYAVHLPRAINVWLKAMKAETEAGAPDWSTRLRAADSFADRFGLPKRQEVTGEDGTPLQQLSDAQLEERLMALLHAYKDLPPPTTEPLDDGA